MKLKKKAKIIEDSGRAVKVGDPINDWLPWSQIEVDGEYVTEVNDWFVNQNYLYRGNFIIENELMADEYSIDTTGDCCVGDEVRFKKDCFIGSYPDAKYSHSEIIEGIIINDSYGKKKQQHTFTILLPNGNKMTIKGRNLYKHGVFRKRWKNEEEREEVLTEKHSRGEEARENRRIRKFD